MYLMWCLAIAKALFVHTFIIYVVFHLNDLCNSGDDLSLHDVFMTCVQCTRMYAACY